MIIEFEILGLSCTIKLKEIKKKTNELICAIITNFVVKYAYKISELLSITSYSTLLFDLRS